VLRLLGLSKDGTRLRYFGVFEVFFPSSVSTKHCKSIKRNVYKRFISALRGVHNRSCSDRKILSRRKLIDRSPL